MKRQRVTSRDVAKAANVSQSTVSLVLHNHPLVKDETRRRVQEVIAQLGYQSHAAAAALRSARSETLSYVVPEISETITDVFRHQILSAFSARTQAAGYHILLDTLIDAQQYTSLFNNGRIDGALVDWRVPGHIVRELYERNVPLVVVGREVSDLPVSWVKADERGGARQLGRHLLALGHRRIALLTAPQEHNAIVTERMLGFQEALAEAGVGIAPNHLLVGSFRYNSGYALAQRVLQSDPRPTAIFAISELMALGALNASLDMGLRVPADVAVVTTEDTPVVEYIRPTLTAAHVPMYEVGACAADLLLDIVNHSEQNEEEGNSSPQHVTLPTTLVIRGSSDAQIQ